MTTLHVYYSPRSYKHIAQHTGVTHAARGKREKITKPCKKKNKERARVWKKRKNEQNYEKERNESSEAERREGESQAHLEACRARELGAQGWKQRFRNTVINLTSDSQHKGHNNFF